MAIERKNELRDINTYHLITDITWM